MRFKYFYEEATKEVEEGKKKCLVMFIDYVKDMSDLFKDHMNKICKENDIDFIFCEVSSGKISKTKLTCGKKTYDIDPSCTIINLRTTKGIDLARKAQDLGFYVFNDPDTLELATDKWRSHQFLEKNNWPSPETYKVKNEKDVEEAAKKIKDYPMVMKIAGGAKGKGVQKCDDYDSLLAACQAIWASHEEEECEKEEPLLIQETLDPKFDVRVNVIDGKVVLATKRKSKGFRNNLSQDGVATDYKLSDKEKKLCEDIAIKMKSEWLGIDLMYKKDKVYVLEINTSPGIASGKEKLGKAMMDMLLEKYKDLG